MLHHASICSTFVNNSAMTRGGALCVEFLNQMTVRDCTFRDNQAALHTQVTSIENLDVYEAIMGYSITPDLLNGGGAIYVTNMGPKLTSYITSCMFDGNVAYAQRGGAVHITSSNSLKVTQSQFTNNR